MQFKAAVLSPYGDLQHHRARAIQVLRKHGFLVDPMEDWSADAQEPKELCRKRLDGCHLCVLLVGRRRGLTPDGESRSITQLEYDEARRLGIDVLVFLLDDQAPWPAEWDERSSDPQLAAWRADVKAQHVVGSFHERPDSIDPALAPALTRWEHERGEKAPLELYLRNIAEEYSVIRYVALAQHQERHDDPIARLYVESRIAPRWISPDTDPKEWPETRPVLDAVTDYSHLVLLGDPGSGKSTLVQWITWQLAHHFHTGNSPWIERLGRLVPLPFILRDLDIRPGVTWDKLLASFVEQTAGKWLTLVKIDKLLRNGKAMILLDGLDEVSHPSARRDLREALFDAWRRCGPCLWLLTSRIVGYDEVPFHTRDPGESGIQSSGKSLDIARLAYVAPFDDAQMQRFANNWFELREANLSTARIKGHEFIDRVHADEGTKRLGRIAHLLTMMALVFRNRAYLPNGRALLYSDIAQVYLETIDFQRRLVTSKEPLREKQRWLARVGFEMQRLRARTEADGRRPVPAWKPPDRASGEICAPGEDVRRWVALAMAASGKAANQADADAFVDYLARRSGLILPRGEDRFAFLHLSFQEFFAAWFLKDEITSPDWLDDADVVPQGARRDDLRRYAGTSAWRETLIFLVELLADENPKWLRRVLPCLFGPDFSDVFPSNETAGGHAVLLARLIVDPQSGFSAEQREAAIRRCCEWEVAEQTRLMIGPVRFLQNNAVIRTLLVVPPPERAEMLEALVDAAKRRSAWCLNLYATGVSDLAPLEKLRKLEALNLARTSVTDLGPLKELPQLSWLDLHGTAVADLSPLAGLRTMKVLNLSDTKVSDLTPLAEMAKLKWLDLHGTLISDLMPLAGLKKLEWLRLSGTAATDLAPLGQLPKLKELDLSDTPVTDLGPLAGMAKLEALYLRRVSLADEQIRQFRIALPQCTIRYR